MSTPTTASSPSASEQVVLNSLADLPATHIPFGQWARLARPQLHCEGWGPAGKWTLSQQSCAGGTAVRVTSRGRWVRWDGILQCGTCHRLDVARLEVSTGP